MTFKQIQEIKHFNVCIPNSRSQIKFIQNSTDKIVFNYIVNSS